MKKKVLLTLAAAMAVSSVSFASPLSNYDQGKLAIDLNTSISPKVELSSGDLSGNDDAKNRLGAAVTYGLGDKWAVQYKYLDNKSKTYAYEDIAPGDYESGTLNAQLSSHEFNVLYQLDPNISAFVGWTKASAKVNYSYQLGTSPSTIIETGSGTEKQSKNGYQIGLIGQTKLADKVTGWASVSAGNKITGYEIGVGYDMSEFTEFNVFYRNTKYKDFNIADEKFDVKTKGLGAGITFKF